MGPFDYVRSLFIWITLDSVDVTEHENKTDALLIKMRLDYVEASAYSDSLSLSYSRGIIDTLVLNI